MSTQTNFEYLRNIIGEECIDQGEFSEEQCDMLGTFMELAKQAYIVVPWPDSQDFMEELWFEEEAILDINSTFGSSAYFIPLVRIFK